MSILQDGYKIIEDFLSHEQLNSILCEIGKVEFPSKAGGIRNAEKKFSSIRKLSSSKQLKTQAEIYLSGEASLVRAILFNKTKENNWLVTWHQDKTIAVSEKFAKNGWQPWSIKDGIPHVQPPLKVLNQMVTFRIHLDDSNQENGCLKVFPKTQQLGILDHSTIQEYIKHHKPVICEARAKSALVMRPHILHSSNKALHPSPTSSITP